MSMRAVIVLNTDLWHQAVEDPESFVEYLDDTVIRRAKTVKNGSFGMYHGSCFDPGITHRFEVNRYGVKHVYLDIDGKEIEVEGLG